MSEALRDILDVDERALLLRIARESIAEFLGTRHKPEIERYPLTANLRAVRSAFVTLRQHDTHELRGCIGATYFRNPLAISVRNNAVNAATRDPRFPPLQRDELPEIEIEISALRPGDTPETPFVQVGDPNEIVVGRDGLYIQWPGTGLGGLLLPQVCGEQGWDLTQFLEGLCRKAGAPPDAWRHPTAKLYRFSAECFDDRAIREGDPPASS